MKLEGMVWRRYREVLQLFERCDGWSDIYLKYVGIHLLRQIVELWNTL